MLERRPVPRRAYTNVLPLDGLVRHRGLKIAIRKVKLGGGETSLCGSLPTSNSFAMIL
jgi:hypothetical protein